MRLKAAVILFFCLFLASTTACGNNANPGDQDTKLSKYIEFRSVTGYFNGEKYSVDLPYFIGAEDNVILRAENTNLDGIAEKIKKSSREAGYQANVSCVLVDDTWISVKVKGTYDNPEGTESEIWATNYNVADNTASSIATLDFPFSNNYEGWLQLYMKHLYQKKYDGKMRIYNFSVPYLYYAEDSRLMAAVVFTTLNDSGELSENAAEIDITDGPALYFSESELETIGEVITVPDGMPSPNAPAEDQNDEYSIKITYVDSKTNEYACQLFSLGQRNPSFPELFDALDLAITFEPGENYGGDYTKVYTFTDDRGYRNFVLKTQYWGEKDWETGFENVCYVGVDSIDGVGTGTIRGPGSMTEQELLILYPHDLYLATKILPGTHAALNLSNPSKAYIYKDPKDKNNRDLVFLVKNGQVVSIDTAASYEYSRYDEKLGLSERVSKQNDKPSALLVKTAAAFQGQFDVQEVLPDYADADLLTGDDRLINVDIEVPEVLSSVPCAALINQRIAAFNPYMIRAARQLNAGNLSVLAESDLVGSLVMGYDLYSYRQTSALVTEAKGHLFQGGGGNAYLIIYYDADTGNLLTPREYLEKCDIAEKSVLEKCAAENYIPSFPGDSVVKTIYDVKFAVDDNGNVILFAESGD